MMVRGLTGISVSGLAWPQFNYAKEGNRAPLVEEIAVSVAG